MREKKSETLEVRLAYNQKRSFMEACQRDGKSASNVIREYLDTYIAPRPGFNYRQAISRWVLAPIGALTVMLLVTGFALVSVSYSTDTNTAFFSSLDTNADGILTRADETPTNKDFFGQFFDVLDQDANGELSAAEFAAVEVFDTSGLLSGESDAAVHDSVSFVTFEVAVSTEQE